jgi:hypothetical protein
MFAQRFHDHFHLLVCHRHGHGLQFTEGRKLAMNLPMANAVNF